jgi:hypothetical protein
MRGSPSYSFAPIADVGMGMRDGRLSPVALAEHCLDRIEALNPTRRSTHSSP